MRSNSASVTVSSDWLRCVVPALFTTMSSPPNVATVAATIASTSALRATSQVTAAAEAAIAAAASRAPAPPTSAIITFAPSRANASAMARPKPEAAPVRWQSGP